MEKFSAYLFSSLSEDAETDYRKVKEAILSHPDTCSVELVSISAGKQESCSSYINPCAEYTIRPRAYEIDRDTEKDVLICFDYSPKEHSFMDLHQQVFLGLARHFKDKSHVYTVSHLNNRNVKPGHLAALASHSHLVLPDKDIYKQLSGDKFVHPDNISYLSSDSSPEDVAKTITECASNIREGTVIGKQEISIPKISSLDRIVEGASFPKVLENN